MGKQLVIGIVALLLLAGAAYFFLFQTPLQKKIVEVGDEAAFDYTLRVEGEERVFDTTIQDVAIVENVFDPKKNYTPLKAVVGPGNNDLLPAFDAALAGMSEGEEKNLTLPPEQAYGQPKENLTRSIELFYAIPRMQEKPLDEFEAKYGNAKENESVNIGFWKVFILNISNDTVIFRNDAREGQAFSILYFTIPLNPTNTSVLYLEHAPAKITSVSEDTFTYKLNVDKGEKYVVRRPVVDAETGEIALDNPLPVTISGVNETHATIDFNHPLAGKTLEFQIFMRSITKRST